MNWARRIIAKSTAKTVATRMINVRVLIFTTFFTDAREGIFIALHASIRSIRRKYWLPYKNRMLLGGI
jgi:hypothetical protein